MGILACLFQQTPGSVHGRPRRRFGVTFNTNSQMELRVKVDQSQRRFDSRTQLRQIAAFVFAILVTLVTATVSAQSLNEPLKVNETFALAAGHFDRQEYDDAAKLFAELAQKHERYEQGKLAWFWLGESQINLGDHAAASQSFQRFLRVMPHHQLVARARFRMAECAMREGKQEIAATLLETFLRDFPSDPLNEYGLPWLGSIRLARGEPQLAQAAFEHALKLYPRSPQSSASRLWLAKALLIQGQTHDAQRFLEFVAEHGEAPLAAEASYLIGKVDFEKGDLESAEEHFLKARDGEAPATLVDEIEYWVARCEIETGRLNDALARLQQLGQHELPPGLAAAVFMDGAAVAGKLGQDDVADRMLATFLRSDPEANWARAALRLRMELAVQRANFQLAAQTAETLLDHYPDEIDRVSVQEIEVAARYRLQRFDQVVARTDADSDLSPKLKYYRALSLLHLNRPDEAIACLQSLQTGFADDEADAAMRSAVQRTLASCQLKRGEYARAIELLTSWLSDHADDPERYDAEADLCRALMMQHRWQTVGKRLDVLTVPDDRRQDHANLLVTLADIALAPPGGTASSELERGDDESGPWAVVEVWYRQAAELAGSKDLRQRALSGQALCLIRMGNGDQALQVWRELAEQAEDFERLRDRARTAARELERADDYRAAASLYGLIAERDQVPTEKSSTELRQAWCLLQTASAVDAERANMILDRIAADDNSTDPQTASEAMFLRYWSAMNRDETTVAADLRRRILQQFPDHPHWFELAGVELEDAFGAGRMDEAERLANEIVGREGADKTRARASYLLGRIAIERRQWDAAAAALKRVTELDPTGPDADRAEYWIAESLYQLQKFAEAASRFGRLEASSGVDSSIHPWVLLRMAQCGLELDDWQAVESASKTGVSQFPDFARRHEWHYMLGRAAARIGMFESAREQFQQVIQSPAGRSSELAAESEWWIGETWFHQQEYKKAIEAYYRVDSLYSFDHWRAAALLQAGKCQERLGNWAHAATLYQQLVRRHPDSEFRDDAERRLAVALQQASRSGADKPARK